MPTKQQLLLLLCLLLTLPTFAQTTINVAEERPYIEVTGTAEREVIPDEIYVEIVILEKYVNKVKVTIEEQETKLKAALQAVGIDLEDLAVSNTNANYVKVRWQKKDVVTKKSYNLKVADANTLGNVFEQLDKLEITNAYIERVDYSKMDSLRKEVKILAIKDAKDKANYLLNAIDERIGEPLIIRETENFEVGRASRNSMFVVRAKRHRIITLTVLK